jgi:hypothetical protein
LVLAAFIFVSYFGINELINPSKGTVDSPFGTTFPNPSDIGAIVSVSVVCGIVLCGIYFYCMQRFTGKMIVVSLVLTIVIQTLFSLLLLYLGNISLTTGQFIFGGILLLLTALTAWVFWSWRHRIPFAKVMLQTVMGITRVYPATYVAGIIGLLCGALIAAYWAISIFGVALWQSGTVVVRAPSGTIVTENRTTNALYGIWIFMIFWFYWSSEIIQNSVHLTVAGLFGTYYFNGKLI